MYTLNCKGKLIDLSTPKVMGIINVTPDSFYDGGNTTVLTSIIDQASAMLAEGTTFLDIGGYSSRPGAEEVSEQQELNRVLPAIEGILSKFPDALLSVDTFRNEVAKRAVEAGACMINDISAGHLDAHMITTVGKLQVPYIMMHMRGTPQTMKDQTEYDHLTKEVLFYFSERIHQARKAGINDIVIDPGFGFAKTTDQNFELLSQLQLINSLDVPILTGISRKSMIYKTLGTTPKEALNGTTAIHAIALQKGTSILRVHDVKEAMQCIALVEKLKTPS